VDTPRKRTRIFQQILKLSGRARACRDVVHGPSPASLVQEAFVKLWLKPPTALQDGPTAAIAGRIFQDAWVEWFRRNRRHNRGASTADAADIELDTGLDTGLDSVRDLRELLKKLERVMPDEWLTLKRHYYEHLSILEIADLQGTSRATVNRRLQRAREWLRMRLGPDSGAA